MTKKERFEKYLATARPNWSLRKYSGGEYMDARTDFAWEIWMEAVKL